MNKTSLVDTLNRPIHDLRISVIDRCNFRCLYCMPDKETKSHHFLTNQEWLSFEEITRLVKIFVSLGVSKVRLTGGEPLLRPDIVRLVRELNGIEGIEDLALTTNASLLAEHADSLKNAGLKRITISLDTLDARLFHEMSGNRGDLKAVLAGIQAAEKAGYNQMKINTVIQKGVNETSILPLINMFRGSQHTLRFIEYMDVGNCNHWESRYVVPSTQIRDVIHAQFPLEALEANYFGEVAERYRFKDGGGEIGFISSISHPFCGSCTRARLSTGGELLTCLFAFKGADLRTPLRQGTSDRDLTQLISSVWRARDDRYSELRSQNNHASNPSQKIEMFQIGG